MILAPLLSLFVNPRCVVVRLNAELNETLNRSENDWSMFARRVWRCAPVFAMIPPSPLTLPDRK